MGRLYELIPPLPPPPTQALAYPTKVIPEPEKQLEKQQKYSDIQRSPNLNFLHSNVKSDTQVSNKEHLNDLVEMLSPPIHILVWL